MRINGKWPLSTGKVDEDLDASHLYDGPEDSIPDYDDYSFAGIVRGAKWEITKIPESETYSWYVSAAEGALSGGPVTHESARASVDRALLILTSGTCS